MPRCEDFPCCGHEAGCCPSFDESGRQTDMVCTCGARLPVNSRFSICDGCMYEGDDERFYDPGEYLDDLALAQQEQADFAQDDMYQREDYGDWGYEGMHEE